MLNRRTLRIKAMQAVYAYMQAEASDYLLALDIISDAFAPDLNSMEVQNKNLLEGKKKMGALLFKQWYDTRSFETDETSKDVLDAVNDAVAFYRNQTRKDFRFYGNQMLSSAEAIYDHYLATLKILEEVKFLIEREEKKKTTRFTEKKDLNAKPFLNNRVLNKLIDNKSFQQLLIRRNVGWEQNEELVRQLYRDVIRKDEAFIAYVLLPEPGFEDDQEIIKHLFKEIIFKDKNLQALFEEQDLNWEENKPIVKSLVLKTVKMLDEQADEDLKLLDLSTNWEDDKAFFEDIYNRTVMNDEAYEKIVSEAVKNWEAERIAVLDKIILKMALCEMHEFPSIPVKVTINEYIEISKLYSTPKSKQFINGVLDKLAQELTRSGQIRKSGRGLIDNK